MIYIADLEDITTEDIFLILNTYESNVIEIAVPKSSQQFFSTSTEIAWDYAYAAYSAQQLSKVGTILMYKFPKPPELESYLFTVQVNDKNSLVQTIYDLSCLYGFTEDKEFIDGQSFEYVDQFIHEVANGETLPIFPVLIDFYKQFNIN